MLFLGTLPTHGGLSLKVNYKRAVYVSRAFTFLDTRQWVLCRAMDFNLCSTSAFNENGVTTKADSITSGV